MASITMYRGDSLLFDVDIRDGDGSAYDLTGCKVWMAAKTAKSELDIDALFLKSSDALDGITIVGSVATVEVYPEDTLSLTGGGVFFYDVQLKDANDRIWTIDTGTITVVEDVTRDYV